MHRKPTISQGRKVLIYAVALMFDFMTLWFSAGFFIYQIILTPVGIGFAMPVMSIITNKFITIIAILVFFVIYITVDFKHKAKEILLKKMIRRFLWPILVKMLPFLGWLPMLTLSNWLLLRIVDKYDKKMLDKRVGGQNPH